MPTTAKAANVSSEARSEIDLSSVDLPAPEAVEDVRALLVAGKGAKKLGMANPVATSGEVHAEAERLSGDPALLRNFVGNLKDPANDPSLRRLIYTAALVAGPEGRVADRLLQGLKALSIDTSSYQRVLDGVSASAIRSSAPIDLERQHSLALKEAPQVLQGGAVHPVPQNTIAISRAEGEPRVLVTSEVYDCVVLTLWNRETKQGVLAHIPVGSTPSLSHLGEELKSLGIDPASLEATIAGGADYALAPDPRTGRLIPTALFTAGRLQDELRALGVGEVRLDIVHSKEEKREGRSNVALDTETGEVFFVHDDASLLPTAPDRGYNELQDRVTDLYFAS